MVSIVIIFRLIIAGIEYLLLTQVFQWISIHLYNCILTTNGVTGDDTITVIGEPPQSCEAYLKLRGGPGDDTLNGQGSDDIVYGYSGDDVIIAPDGNDHVDGGSGEDPFSFWGSHYLIL
jgi:Ca2+-binding RTX toxin-like protein